jgi:hypothetical protein
MQLRLRGSEEWNSEASKQRFRFSRGHNHEKKKKKKEKPKPKTKEHQKQRNKCERSLPSTLLPDIFEEK